MKKITLKKLGKEEDKDFLDYKEIIKLIASTPSLDRNGRSQGFSIDQVRKALRIIKATEKASNGLELEDADFNLLKSKAQEFKWAMASENITQFMDDLEAADKEA